MLSLCWAGGWTRWFPEVPSTSPHLCHSTDVTLPRDANETVQSFYLDFLSRDLGRAILWNFVVAFNAPRLSEFVSLSGNIQVAGLCDSWSFSSKNYFFSSSHLQPISMMMPISVQRCNLLVLLTRSYDTGHCSQRKQERKEEKCSCFALSCHKNTWSILLSSTRLDADSSQQDFLHALVLQQMRFKTPQQCCTMVSTAQHSWEMQKKEPRTCA